MRYESTAIHFLVLMTACMYTQIAPYTTCLVNGVFWAPNTPRLLSIAQSSSLHPVHMDTSVLKLQGVPALPQRLLAVADISCDLHVSTYI